MLKQMKEAGQAGSTSRALTRCPGRIGRLASVLLLAAAWVAGPAAHAAAPLMHDGNVSAHAEPDIPLQTLTTGLERPWGMAQLPDGDLLVTQKSGALVRLTASGKLIGAISGIPAVQDSGQGGLLGIAIDPDFASGSRWVYLSYAEAGTGKASGLAGTAVARGKLVGQALTDVEVIFRQQPKVDSGGHYGSRLVFGRDKALFITTGERMKGEPSQDLQQTLGKIIRIQRDGSIPPGNPDFGQPARPGVWSYGHRNVQGAALHPSTGELWISEHGPQGGDEINIARAGQNYGWPLKSYGCPYGSPVGEACRIGGGTQAPGFVEPLTTWVPLSIAPAGLTFYTGSMFPAWRGNLFSGSLAGQALWRLTLDGDKVVARQRLYASLGERFRDVIQAQDGALLMLTDSGKLMRLAR